MRSKSRTSVGTENMNPQETRPRRLKSLLSFRSQIDELLSQLLLRLKYTSGDSERECISREVANYAAALASIEVALASIESFAEKCGTENREDG